MESSVAVAEPLAKKPKRDELGRYVKGTPAPNPAGMPGTASRIHILKLFRQAVPDETLRQIIIRAAKDAVAGDRYARKFIFDYLVGPPAQAIEAQITTTSDIANNTTVTRIAAILAQLPVDTIDSDT